ncbi:MAG TPA: glutathione S-transferase family protein [Kiloniellaceae bacterium]|nr:glutathione S-transferase family protein [Kiloniellaceae bacterium]
MIRLLGRSTSGNVQKVLFLLEELGIAYDREDYGRQFGNTGTDDYLSMNPTGKVPTLVDGDLVVWESNSILRYLAAKTDSPLYPADPAARSRIERWMDWLLASLNTPYVSAFKATKGGEAVPPAVAKEIADGLALLEAQLADGDFVAGDALSLADIALAPIVGRCLGFGLDLPELPAVKAWQARLAERPAYKAAIGG